MPLPDSEPAPDRANIYEQLRTKTTESLDRETLNIVRSPLDLDPASEDVLRRIKLVGEVSGTLSSSGPIEVVMKGPIDMTLNNFHAITRENMGITDDDDGVFEFNSIYCQCTQSDPSSTFYLRAYYYDATLDSLPTPGAAEFVYSSTTGAFIEWSVDSQTANSRPVYVQFPTQLGVKFSGSGQTNLKMWFVYTRVR